MTDYTAWNTFLQDHPEAHILQTAEWGQLKAAFGWETAHVLTPSAGAQVLFRRLPLGLRLAYLPKGPVGQPDAAFWAQLDALCRRRRAVFLKIEPDAWEDETPSLPPGFRPSPHHIQPPRTIVVDLSAPEDEILARMKQKTRYNIRLAARKGVTVRPWDDLDGFHALMQVTGGRDGFGVHSAAYYRRAWELFQPRGLAELLVAEYENRPLAALMVFARGRRAWYLYGASSSAERNRMPTYLLQWEAMRWAKTRGCTEYDLWGVPDASAEALEAAFKTRRDGLWGVYRFKRGFGGTVRRAASARDRVYRPALYAAYRLWLARRGGTEA